MRPARPLILALLPLTLLAGCLIQESTLVLRYDRTTDTFHLFTLYEHFRSSGTGLFDAPKGDGDASDPVRRRRWAARDAESLRLFFEARDHVIPLPPFSLNGPLHVRLADDHTRPIDPGVDAADLDVAWKDIQIRPGRLFRDRDGHLGYYHEVAVPGRVVDQLLRAARTNLTSNTDLRTLVAEVTDRRYRTAAKPDDWTALAQSLARDLVPDPPTGENLLPRIFACMDDTSLRALRDLFSPGSAGPDLSRAGTILRLHLPLTRRDTTGLNHLARTCAQAIATAKPNPSASKAQQHSILLARQTIEVLRQTTTATLEPDGSCILTLDLQPTLNDVFQALRQLASTAFAQDPTAQAAARAMSNSVQNWPPPTPPIDSLPNPKTLLNRSQHP